jgi:O-antigen/teichoic acid export membrane protein
LLLASLGLVTAVSAAITGAAYLIPDAIIGVLFGAAYLPVAPMLWLYAAATALYALANVVINYRLSANNKLGSVFVVAAGIAQVAALWLFHATLRDVVLIQIAIMSCLLVATLAWDLWLWRGERAKGKLVRA